MSKWTIRTGDYRAEVDHAPNMNAMTAAVLAFEADAPKMTGLITKCVHPDGTEFYVSSERALVRAGYDFDKKGRK